MKQIVSVTMIDDEQCGADGAHEAARHESAADLQRAQAERGGRPEQRREDRQDVDRLAEPSLGPLAAEQRDERRAEQLRTAAAERAVGDGQTDDGVDRPRVQGPVEQRGGHRHVERLGTARRGGARRGRGEVGQRFGDAVEHQPDAHAGAEHHRDPGRGPELRCLVVAAERDAAVTAHRDVHREDDEAAGGQHERPAAAGDDAAEHGLRDGAEVLGAEHTPGDERQDDHRRDPEHHAVDDRVILFGGRDRRRRGGRIGRDAGLALLKRHGRRPWRCPGPCPLPCGSSCPAPSAAGNDLVKWREETEPDRYARQSCAMR